MVEVGLLVRKGINLLFLKSLGTIIKDKGNKVSACFLPYVYQKLINREIGRL